MPQRTDPSRPRRFLAWSLALLAAAFCPRPASGQPAAEPEAKPGRPPNVVVIFCDDLGYGDLTCYGHPTIATPNLDAMAEAGQRWTEFYVAANVCTPSRAALMTGRYPIRSGMTSGQRVVLFPDSAGGLPEGEVTLAEMLKAAGYATHAIGKWHLGHLPQFLPTQHGFDSYFGVPYSNDMDVVADAPRGRAKFLEPRIEYFNVPLLRGAEEVERPADQRTLTRRYTEEAVRLIEEAGDDPFFIYLAHTMPHVPLFASDNFLGTSRRGLYGDVIEEIDWSAGQIVDTLKKRGLAENTLVVFSSDNGPWKEYAAQGGSAGMLREGKGTTWEGGMRVPGIFFWPGTIEPQIVAGAGSTLDLMPTLATLCGAALPTDRPLDGVDLSATLREGAASPRREMIYYQGEEVFAVRGGEFKAHFKTRSPVAGIPVPVDHDPPLLFHLGHDPGEQYDVAAAHPDVIDRLRQLRAEHEASVQRVENQLIKK